MMETEGPRPKETVREEYRRLRRGLDPAAPRTAGTSMAKHALSVVPELVPPGSTVAAYLSAGSEPGTRALLEGLRERGYDVVVPVCQPDRRLLWCRWTPDAPLVPGLFPSVPEPAGERVSAAQLPGLSMVLVPALAVDKTGVRMGKGGGYYDRFLSGLRAAGNRVPAVGLVYDHEFAPAHSWPADAFDQPMDAVLTPSGWTVLPYQPVYS